MITMVILMKEREQQFPSEPSKIVERILLVSYWILFVILPTVLVYRWLPDGWTLTSGLVFYLLLCLSEFGFRRWLRIWLFFIPGKRPPS